MKYRVPISLLFIFLLLISVNSIVFSVGEQTDYKEDFEDDIIGFQSSDSYYGSTYIESYNLSEGCEVDNAQSHSGSKSYAVPRHSGDYKRVFFNLSVSSCYNVSIWIKRAFADTKYLYFDFNNITNVTIIRVRSHNDGTGKMYYECQKHDSSWDRIGTGAENTEWHNISVNMTAVDNVTYWYKTEHQATTPFTINTDIEDSSIAYIWVKNSQDNSDNWIDDIKLDVGFLGGGEETETIPPCSPYNTIGSLTNYDGDMYHIYPFLWTAYSVATTMYITRLDLRISDYMIDKGVLVTDLYAKLNSHELGHPNELVQLGDDDDYRVSWTNLNFFIDNEPTTIVFFNSKHFDYNGQVYWYLPYTETDINNDGLDFYVNFLSPVYYNNNPSDDSPSGMPYSSTYHNSELVVRMCVEIDSDAEFNEDLLNDISVFPLNPKKGDTVIINWEINQTSMAYTSYVYVDPPNNDDYIAETITSQTGHIDDIFMNQMGIWWFNLSINGVNKSSAFCTVSGKLTDWIYTTPNPSHGGAFTIVYNYTGTDTGAIRIYDCSGNKVGVTYHIEAVSSGNITHSLPKHGVYQIHLCSVSEIGSNIIYNTIKTHQHIVSGYVISYIDVDPEHGFVKIPMYLFGEHSHLGQDINVYVGGSFIGSVSCLEYFALEYTPIKTGTFTAKLILTKPNGEVLLLSSKEFTVSKSGYIEPDPLLPKLNPAIGVMVGSIVVIVFTLIPMLVTLGFKKQPPHNSFLYLFFGGIGVVLNIGFGFWEFWTAFFILFLGVIIIIGLYFVGKKH